MNKVIITGSSGLLGSHFLSFLKGKCQVLGLDRNTWHGANNLKTIKIDLTNFKELDQIITDFEPNIIINCAAMTQIEKCETNIQDANNVNHLLPKNISKFCSNNCKIIQISTDAVYGKNETEMKNENSPTDPNNVYSISKLNGEKTILEHSNSLILRTNIYGWSFGLKKTFGEWLFESLENNSEINLYDNIFFTPIYVPELVKVVYRLIQSNSIGLFNIGGPSRISKYTFAKKIADLAGFNFTNVNKIPFNTNNSSPTRSLDLSINSNKIIKLLSLEPSSLDNHLTKFIHHKDLPLESRF